MGRLLIPCLCVPFVLTCLLQSQGGPSVSELLWPVAFTLSQLYARAGCPLLPRCSTPLCLEIYREPGTQPSFSLLTPIQLSGENWLDPRKEMPRLEWWPILSTVKMPGELLSQAQHHGISPGLGSSVVVGFTPKPENVKFRVWICFPSVSKDGQVKIQRDKVFS